MPHTIFKIGILRKIVFDSDGSTFIFDNYNNAHIFPEGEISTDNIYPIISNGVANIFGKYLIPKGIGTVICYWTDDEVKMNTKKIKNVL